MRRWRPLRPKSARTSMPEPSKQNVWQKNQTIQMIRNQAVETQLLPKRTLDQRRKIPRFQSPPVGKRQGQTERPKPGALSG